MHHRTDTEESAVFKPLAVAVSLGCAALSSGANAYQYGEYAGETLERLITDYPGRYRGTASFAGATEPMQSRLGFGYQTSRQDFTWAGNRSSQNVIASAPGSSGKVLVLGAHYDTYYGRPTLQGLDDNASGAAVLTEIARNLGGIALENGLEVVGFGAEEEGLRGSRAYVESLDASQRANLLGMINLDSLVTGDRMYAHAGSNSVANPALGAYREQILRIARELDIPLSTNPGLNAEYPAGTGCCSDGESFNGMDIPVLFIEATNWELGDLDGYEQTDNPAIPGGSTWHDPAEDNKEVLTGAFGQERIDQRMRDFSRLLTRLVLELTNADLLASTASGGALARQMEDQLQRQHQALTRLHDRRWLTLLGSSRPVGSFDGEVGAEGEVSPDSGFDMPGDPESRRAGVHLLGDYRYSEALTLGASLAFQRSRDKLDHGGRIEGDTWQASACSACTTTAVRNGWPAKQTSGIPATTASARSTCRPPGARCYSTSASPATPRPGPGARGWKAAMTSASANCGTGRWPASTTCATASTTSARTRPCAPRSAMRSRTTTRWRPASAGACAASWRWARGCACNPTPACAGYASWPTVGWTISI